MNKAFVREPEFDGRAYCPRCGSLGLAVTAPTLDALITEPARGRLTDSAWFCEYARCDVVYFNLFESVVTVDELQRPVYPKDPAAPICACFGFSHADIEADVADAEPHRIRALLARSKSPEAHCRTAAPSGRCCMTEVQRLYMRLRQAASKGDG